MSWPTTDMEDARNRVHVWSKKHWYIYYHLNGLNNPVIDQVRTATMQVVRPDDETLTTIRDDLKAYRADAAIISPRYTTVPKAETPAPTPEPTPTPETEQYNVRTRPHDETTDRGNTNLPE